MNANKPDGIVYFDEIMHRKLIVGEWINGTCLCSAGQKLGKLKRLVELSHLSYAKPKSDLSETSKGGSRISALEYRAKYTVARLAMLGHIKDDGELRWVDYWTRWNINIIQALDAGTLEYKAVKSILNSALGDIVKATERDNG
jgi:hypothetical protein